MDDNTNQIKDEQINKNSGKKWLLFFINLVLLVILACAGATVYAWYQIFIPIDQNNAQESVFLVEKGRGVKEIAAKLKQENLIRSQFWFEIYIWYKEIETDLQAGQYSLSPNLNIPEILQIITGGKVIPNEAQITFPEGFTYEQIKERLITSGVESARDFDEEKIDGFQVQYKFLSAVSPELRLEGFLFPDTYRFKKDLKKEEIIKKFLDNFDKKITPALRAEISQQGKSIYEIIIMASIVQQEALSEDEMAMISGIFWNRIKKGMLLQSDATVNYATGKKARQPSFDDIEIQSLYNTYLYVGLPPTPICNPGLAAIQAAVYPQASDFYYFLHPLNSPAVYSKTFEEHNKNKARYLK